MDAVLVRIAKTDEPLPRLFGRRTAVEDRLDQLMWAELDVRDAAGVARAMGDFSGARFASRMANALLDAKFGVRRLDLVPSLAQARAEAPTWMAQADRLEQLTIDLAGSGSAANATRVQEFARGAVQGDVTARDLLRSALYMRAVRADPIARSGPAHEIPTRNQATVDDLIGQVAAAPDADVVASLLSGARIPVLGPLEHVVGSKESARYVLDFARSMLNALDESGTAPQQLRSSTRVLVDRNVSRIAGRTPVGSVGGYGNHHPDYAEVGRVQANLRLLQALDANGVTTGSVATKNPPTREMLTW